MAGYPEPIPLPPIGMLDPSWLELMRRQDENPNLSVQRRPQEDAAPLAQPTPQGSGFVPPHMRLRGMLSGLNSFLGGPDALNAMTNDTTGGGMPMSGLQGDASADTIVPRSVPTTSIRPSGETPTTQNVAPQQTPSPMTMAGPSGMLTDTLASTMGVRGMGSPQESVTSAGDGQGATTPSTTPVGQPLQITPPTTSGSTSRTSTPDSVPETSLWGRLSASGGPLDRLGTGISNNGLTLMALGAGLAGAPSMGTGISRGLAGAVPAAQADQKMLVQNQTAKFLMTKMPGLSHEQALGIAGSPAILSQLIPSLVGPKALTPIHTTDILGHQVPFGSYNSATGQYFDTNMKPLTTSSSPTMAGAPNVAPDKWAVMTPEERLNAVDPQVRNEIKAIYEGRQSATGKTVQQLLPLVNSIYPDFTMQDYKIKADTIKSFTGQGKNALEIKSANTAVTHADNLEKPGGLIDRLGNYSVAPGLLNAATQGAKNLVGNTEFQKTKGEYEAQVEGLAGELSKAFNGGQTSDTDRQNWRHRLSMTNSPAELHAVIKQAMEMLHGRLEASAESYSKGMGSMRNGIEMLDPKNQTIFSRMRGLNQPSAETATQPQGNLNDIASEMRRRGLIQ